MNYDIMAKVYWQMFKGGFKRELKNTLGLSDTAAIIKKAKVKYREMIESIQPFEQKTRFISNIIIGSILGGIYHSLDPKPDIEKMTVFTREALMNNRFMLKGIVSEKNYTVEGQEKLRLTAEKSLSDSNPYSWQFTYEKGKSLMEYTATFKTCGILYLYRMWRIEELTPAMCKLDYDMAAANNTKFIREQTLADGGKYCDCHYIHRKNKGE